MDEVDKKDVRQIDLELGFLNRVVNRTEELSHDFEDKLNRIMMSVIEKDADNDDYKEICDVATEIRRFKDTIISANERFSSILSRIEL